MNELLLTLCCIVLAFGVAVYRNWQEAVQWRWQEWALALVGLGCLGVLCWVTFLQYGIVLGSALARGLWRV